MVIETLDKNAIEYGMSPYDVMANQLSAGSLTTNGLSYEGVQKELRDVFTIASRYGDLNLGINSIVNNPDMRKVIEEVGGIQFPLRTSEFSEIGRIVIDSRGVYFQTLESPEYGGVSECPYADWGGESKYKLEDAQVVPDEVVFGYIMANSKKFRGISNKDIGTKEINLEELAGKLFRLPSHLS